MALQAVRGGKEWGMATRPHSHESQPHVIPGSGGLGFSGWGKSRFKCVPLA